MNSRYVIRRAFKDYTPQEFHSYVTSLYKAPDVIPDAKGAPGIRITKGKKALVIKCTREGKQVTTAELVALALEYQLDQETLRTALTKRKFQIVNEEGEVTNVEPKRTRRGRAAKPASEGNAHLDQARLKDACEGQLLQLGSAPDLSQESSLQSEPGVESA